MRHTGQAPSAPPAAKPPPTSPVPQCVRGADGQTYCGFNCRPAPNGKVVCASSPNGECAVYADGTYTCR